MPVGSTLTFASLVVLAADPSSPLPSGTLAAPAAEGTPIVPAVSNDARIERLIQALSSDDSYKVRLQAAVRLGRSGDERAVEPLIEALSNDPHYTVRAGAATALANLNQPRAIAHIVKRLAVDGDDFVKAEAARALGKFPRELALPYVVAAYNSDEPRVRRQVIEYVAAEPTALTHPALARALGDVPEVASIAKAAVKKLPPAELMQFLDGALDHREPSVRRGAIEMLQSQASAEAAQRILRIYEKDIEEDEVKHAARQALRDLRRHLPIEQIVKDATQNPEKHARARSLRLLGVVGGK
jgi:HEAT repeat protein